MPSLATLTRVTVLPPPREGSRPRIEPRLPHLQADQFSPPHVLGSLIERCLAIPDVLSRESRMAAPGTCALALPDHAAGGPSEAFIDAHEFCHLHPGPEGSIHLTLPDILGAEVERLAWGERHPIGRLGLLPAVLTVYAPRNPKELDAVFDFVLNSCLFARGKLWIPPDAGGGAT